MDRRGLQEKDNGHRRASWRSRKPPRAGDWKPSVPAWERDFCREVGTLKWGTFSLLKQFTHLYDNVMTNWEDSAAKEAFDGAKRRYWAKINGLPYNVPLPDPDLYIDEIDWDSTEEIPDLDSISFDTKEEDKPVVIFSDVIVEGSGGRPRGWDLNDDDGNYNCQATVLGDEKEKAQDVNQRVTRTGWGDEEEKAQNVNQQVITPTRWGDEEEKAQGGHQSIQPTGWGDEEKAQGGHQATKPTGWGDEEKAQGGHQSIRPTGWGDEVEMSQGGHQPIQPTGWGDEEEAQGGHQAIQRTGWGDEENAQDGHKAIQPMGWGDEEANPVEVHAENPPTNFNIGTGWGTEAEEEDPAPLEAQANNRPEFFFGTPFQGLNPTGWGDEEENVQVPTPIVVGSPWAESWGGYPFNMPTPVPVPMPIPMPTVTVPMWSDYFNVPWQYGGGGSQFPPWNGGWDGPGMLPRWFPPENVGGSRFYNPRRGRGRGRGRWRARRNNNGQSRNNQGRQGEQQSNGAEGQGRRNPGGSFGSGAAGSGGQTWRWVRRNA